MLTAFPTPILSIAADAVRDLEGREALSGLWILFTRCKESLQDGRRLENISWRLWYREMMREDLMNRRYKEKLSVKEDQDYALSPLEAHTHRPPTPPSTPAPPYAVWDANGLTDSTYRPLISAPTVLPHDHDHSTSSPTFSSSRLGPTQVTMFRSTSPGDSASIPPLDSASASLQVSKPKFNSDTVLSPVILAQPFFLSSSSTEPKSRDFARDPPPIRQSTHRRKVQDPVCVGRIIYDMLPRNASEEFRSRATVWSPTTTWKSPSSAPVVDPSSALQVAALRPVALVGLPPSPELISTSMTIASMPSPTPSASSPLSPQILGNVHIFGLPPDPQLPPRLVVVKATPNPTPHPTPPASPLILSSASSSPAAGTGSNDRNGPKSNWLSLPSNHHPRIQDLCQDPAASTKKKKIAVKKIKTKPKSFKKNSLRSLTSPPPPPPLPLQQENGVLAPPMARRATNGRSSSRSTSRSGSSVGVGAGTNSSRRTSKDNIGDVCLPPPAALNTNTKQENLVSSALAAKVKRTLADPLLPGQHKRTIMLTTSDREYKDSDDDGSWSSEDKQDGRRAEQQQQQELLAQQYHQQQEQFQRQLQKQQQLQQQQQQQLQQIQHRPPPLQRAHTTQHPPTANHNLTHGANHIQRAQSSRDHRHHSKGQALITQAAEEAQRQRDMFAKKPTESFQKARTRRVGLLSQLMNPNPTIFRVSQSMAASPLLSEVQAGSVSTRRSNAVGGGHEVFNGFGIAKHPTPIPVGHPYNLPPPVPPSTPRTTRRLMVSNEMSESIRRNLLWERQVSKVNLAAAVRRTASTGGSRHLVPGGVQPLTDRPKMVTLLPKGTMVLPNPGSPVRLGQGSGIKEKRAGGGAGDGPGPSAYDENERERERRVAMARNRSWANDFHFAGW